MKKFRSLQRGVTAVESLVSVFIGMLVALVVFQQFLSLFAGQKSASEVAASGVDARTAIDTLADHLRNAAVCSTNNQGFSQALAGTFTYYTDSSCNNTVKYIFTSGGLTPTGTLKRIETTNGVSTTTTLLSKVSTLTFTYYKATSYNSQWTAISGSPSPSDLPFVCGVQIDVNVSADGTAKGAKTRISTIVRLRNLPKKNAADGLS